MECGAVVCKSQISNSIVSVYEISDLLFSHNDHDRALAVLRVYCDESYDKEHRVYAMGGYIGRDRHWNKLSRLWRNRCLRDGVPYFHAADCEDGRDVFQRLDKEKRNALKRDLIELAGKWRGEIVGFGMAVYISDYDKVRTSSPKAAFAMPEKHYFFCFEALLGQICQELNSLEFTGAPAYIFDQQEEFSGRAKQSFDLLKLEKPELGARMGSLSYQDKRRFVPLQVADNLAYEVMKGLLNQRFDPDRPERKALTELRKCIKFIRYADKYFLEQLIAKVPDPPPGAL